MGGGSGGFFNDISNAIGGFFDDVGNVFNDIGKEVGKVIDQTTKALIDINNFLIKDLVFNSVATVFEVVGLDGVGQVFRDIGDVVSNTTGAVIQFAGNTLKNPKSLITDKDGHISLFKIAALAAAIMSGPVGIAAYVTIQSGATLAFFGTMAQKGWIDHQTAYIAAMATNLIVGYFAIPDGGQMSQGIQNVLGTTHDLLIALGVGADTAAGIINFIVESTMIADTFNAGMKLYDTASSVYKAYIEKIAFDKSLREAMAAFEAWKKQFDDKVQQSDYEALSFANCQYFKYFPGQEMYNIGMPGREKYTVMDTQEPCYGIFHKPLTNEDKEISRLLWSNPRYDMAGGSSFMDTQLQYQMVKMGW